MPHFVREQLTGLLKWLTSEVHAARKSPDPECVHRLRVSLRRFLAALRVFRDLLPARRTAKLVRRLDAIRKTAAHLRDRDIALGLLAGDPFAENVGPPAPPGRS